MGLPSGVDVVEGAPEHLVHVGFAVDEQNAVVLHRVLLFGCNAGAVVRGQPSLLVDPQRVAVPLAVGGPNDPLKVVL